MLDGGQDFLPVEPPVVDEEFDLSDIMGEQLDSQMGTKEDRLRQLEEQVAILHHAGSPRLSRLVAVVPACRARLKFGQC